MRLKSLLQSDFSYQHQKNCRRLEIQKLINCFKSRFLSFLHRPACKLCFSTTTQLWDINRAPASQSLVTKSPPPLFKTGIAKNWKIKKNNRASTSIFYFFKFSGSRKKRHGTRPNPVGVYSFVQLWTIIQEVWLNWGQTSKGFVSVVVSHQHYIWW